MEQAILLQQSKFNVFSELEKLKSSPKKYIDCPTHGNTLALVNGVSCQACRDESNETKDVTESKLRAGLKGRYLYYNFDDYECENDSQRRLKDKLQTYNSNTNLILIGNCGTGKSMWASILIDKFIRMGDKCGYIQFNNLAKLTIEKSIELDRMVSSDFLVIDEIGVGNSDFKGIVLQDIINERYIQKKGTMLISNLNVEELIEFLSEPIYSRLKEKCISHNMAWYDYRLKSN